jgi:hypothetical protein
LGYRFAVSITKAAFPTKALSYARRLHTTPARLRTALRSGVIGAAAAAPLLVASAAMAATSNHDYNGEDSGPGLTVLQTIGIFVCIPLGLFLLITFLVCLPGWMKGDRNRREVGWVGAAPATATAGAGKASADQAGEPAKETGTGGASGTW